LFWKELDLAKESILAHEFGHAALGSNHDSDISGYSYFPPRNLSKLSNSADFVDRAYEFGFDSELQQQIFQIKLRMLGSAAGSPPPYPNNCNGDHTDLSCSP